MRSILRIKIVDKIRIPNTLITRRTVNTREIAVCTNYGTLFRVDVFEQEMYGGRFVTRRAGAERVPERLQRQRRLQQQRSLPL